jgi:hypothetical protein
MQSPTPPSVQQLVAEGISAAHAGDAALARNLLCAALQIDSKHERAWLWLSGVVATDAECRYCLERVLELDPNHVAARRGLDRLPAVSTPMSPLPVVPIPSPVSTAPTVVPAAPPEAAVTPDQNAPTVLAPLSLLDIIAGPTAPTAVPGQDEVATGVRQPDRILALLSSVPTPTTFSSQPTARPAERESRAVRDQAGSAHLPTPAPQLDRKVIKFVVSKLGKHTSRNDVIRELTEWRRLAWSDAARLVAEVERKHLRSITLRQGPFYLVLAAGTMLGGLLMVVGSGIRLYLALKYPSVETPLILVRSGVAFLSPCAASTRSA